MPSGEPYKLNIVVYVYGERGAKSRRYALVCVCVGGGWERRGWKDWSGKELIKADDDNSGDDDDEGDIDDDGDVSKKK